MHTQPYADTANDGIVQLPLTLPLQLDERAQQAARRYTMLMGISNPLLAHAENIAPGFAFFVVYGPRMYTLDLATIAVQTAVQHELATSDLTDMLTRHLGHRITALGAAIESEAHTVGIDAIFNAKGFAGHEGLERFPAFRALNLGAQVSCEELLRIAQQEQAEVILVSQIVTQKISMYRT
jgi:beta-lysine 5,6-aminomutase beta subunit